MKHAAVPALAAPASELQMLDVAIALLTAARGRDAGQVAALIEASRIVLGAVAPDAAPTPLVVDPPMGRKPRGGARRGKKARKPRPPSAAAVAPAPAQPPASEPSDAIELHGITVSFDPDSESVSYRGKVMDVTARQAAFVAALVRAMPSPCAREFLAKKVWPTRKVPEFFEQILSTIAGELKAPLAALGLEVKTVRGVGFVLAVPGVEA